MERSAIKDRFDNLSGEKVPTEESCIHRYSDGTVLRYKKEKTELLIEMSVTNDVCQNNREIKKMTKISRPQK